MSRAVSLFPRYSQRENRTTNYCLLVLKMLYEENPKLLGEALSELIDPDIGGKVGVVFKQQEKKALSIPDGLVQQAPISIYIETKNFDWFHEKQLINHLEALDREATGVKVLLALSNFEDTTDTRFSAIQKLCSEKYANTIVFKAASFQDFIESVQLEHLPKNLLDAIIEFRAYLDAEDLLPSWQNLLDVVNCAGLPDDIIKENIYICPATGGAYNHSRCKYFGMYRNKKVERIALIKAVIDVEDSDQAYLKWKNAEESNESLLKIAKEKVTRLRSAEYPKRAFLLGNGFVTSFVKDTPGGMQTSKQYFNIEALNIKDAEDLARTLNGKTWSELRLKIAF